MKKPFEVGQRVAFYCGGRRDTGVIKKISELTGMVTVATDRADFFVHPKQCRRLVKKERRRFWIDIEGAILSDKYLWRTNVMIKNPGLDSWVEVVEVKKK